VFSDAYTDQETRLEPEPIPVLVIVKLPLTEPFAAVPDEEIPETEYVGPTTVTGLPDANTPPGASSDDCTFTFI
jgi:hypothetical protein